MMFSDLFFQLTLNLRHTYWDLPLKIITHSYCNISLILKIILWIKTIQLSCLRVFFSRKPDEARIFYSNLLYIYIIFFIAMAFACLFVWQECSYIGSCY